MVSHSIRIASPFSRERTADMFRSMTDGLYRRELLRRAGLLSSALLGGACGLPPLSTTTPRKLPEVGFRVTDTAIEAPDRIEEGIVAVTLENAAQKPRNLIFPRLADASAEDFRAAIAKSLDAGFALTELFGGTIPVEPGERQRVVFDLAPGRYALLSLASVPGRAPLFTLLEVVSSAASRVAEPRADLAIILRDLVAISVPGGISSAEQTWKVTPEGSLPHSLGLAVLLPGKTKDDALAWLKSRSGPAPLEAVGGMGFLGPGRRCWFVVTLKRGNYLAFCNVPGPKQRQTHFDLGEFASFVV
jgi:hypothetical protein